MNSRGEHRALLSLILLASSLSLSIGTVTVPPNENAQSIKVEQVVSIQTVDDQNLLLLNLNDFVNPIYEGSLSNNKGISIQRNTLGSLFYVTNLPHIGELLQAYRLSPCSYVWPSSCQACCYTASGVPLSAPCCSKVDSSGTKVFNVGEAITDTPSTVTAHDSGILWFRPPISLFTNQSQPVSGYNTSVSFAVDFWILRSPPSSVPNGTESSCSLDRSKCKGSGDIHSKFCGTCTNSTFHFNISIQIQFGKKYPQVGFGGQMLSFDGGDDFMIFSNDNFPQYEFSIQLWIQHDKIHSGQTLLTIWSDARGREFEIADTSNLHFYHLNNRSLNSGVGINDGLWHHLAFSWRLVCSDPLQGSTYCFQSESCQIERDCIHVEIAIFVDGSYRTSSYLPAVTLSPQNEVVIGQKMTKKYQTAESTLRERFYQLVTSKKSTSEINTPYTDNELLLMFNRLRSNYLNNAQLFEGSVPQDNRWSEFVEDEPWRNLFYKYCELMAPGGYSPWAALSANIDEFRLYGYFRTQWDIQIAYDVALNGDAFYTFNPIEANYSLLIYYSFDFYGKDYLSTSRDNFREWPLQVRDESVNSANSPGSLGGGEFLWAPMQVASTAPIYGSRTIQIVLPDSTQPIPLNLISIAFEKGLDQSAIFSRVETNPSFGEIYLGADDCDNVEVVCGPGYTSCPDLPSTSNNQQVIYRPKGCKGSIIGVEVISPQMKGCKPGVLITASDGGSGRNVLGNITQVSTDGGVSRVDMINMGEGYDWTYAHPSILKLDDPSCICNGSQGVNSINNCLEPLISAGKGRNDGVDFVGFEYGIFIGSIQTLHAFPVMYKVSCTPGDCVSIKPRPCLWSCHRSVGWMTDVKAVATQFSKRMVGSFSEYPSGDTRPTAYWSNSQHVLWYVPTHLGEANYYIKDSTGFQLLQDTIKDEFIIRKFDYLPGSEFIVNTNSPPPFVHVWFQIILEKLAIPLNSSITWQESSSMLIHLQVLDYHRGTSVLNAPFSVFVNTPVRGQLYQAERISKSHPDFPGKCVCPLAPRFPTLTRQPESLYYPANTTLPGSYECDLESIGEFCFMKGDLIANNDTEVTSFIETRVIPGFQHARDGFFVIYEMEKFESGSSQFKWYIKHPQGQETEAFVDIHVRSVNNRPVALNSSVEVQEDTISEIYLKSRDLDDQNRPQTFVIKPPIHGTLYQCVSASNSSSCAVGNRLSSVNESIFQWANISVVDTGAIDDQDYPVVQVVNRAGEDLRMMINRKDSSIILNSGYGYNSWSFNSSDNGNFKALCGRRGTVAADVTIEKSVYLTGMEIFYPIRFDTPFRILAERPAVFNDDSHDYNEETATRTLQDIPLTSRKVDLTNLSGYDSGSLHFDNEGYLVSSEEYTLNRVSCANNDHSQLSVCSQVWNSTAGKGRYIVGRQHHNFLSHFDTWFENYGGKDILNEIHGRRYPENIWFELFRGLPNQVQRNNNLLSLDFEKTIFQSSHLRLEACSQDGRTFNGQNLNFLQFVKKIRVMGTYSKAPRGMIQNQERRVVYIPFHNFAGEDMFTFAVRDHGGNAATSSSRFSQQIHWSPEAYVRITVKPTIDFPTSSNVLINQKYTDNSTFVRFPLQGVQPSPDGAYLIDHFALDVTSFPSHGSIRSQSGNTLTSTLSQFSGFLLYQPNPTTCGLPYSRLQYRLINATEGQNLPSLVNYGGNARFDVRCGSGSFCQHAVSGQVGWFGTCQPCPRGYYGMTSAISNQCQKCPAGQYQDELGSSTCILCPPGFFSGFPGSPQCSACPAGTYSEASGQTKCTPCIGGTFASSSGSSSCSKCGSTHFTYTGGSTSCTPCPNNTRTISDRADGINKCVCAFGTYDVLGRAGHPCFPCPHGAYCHGGTLLPVARTGYWTSQAYWTQDRYDPAVSAVYPGRAVFAPCSFNYIRGVCIGYPDVNVQEREAICLYRNDILVYGPERLDIYTSAGINVNQTNCTLQYGINNHSVQIDNISYSINAHCSMGYTGVLCSTCAPEFYRFIDGLCYLCPFNDNFFVMQALYFAYAIVVSTMLWAFVFWMIPSRARSMYMIITHVQLLAVFGKYSIPLERNAQRLLSMLSIFNLNFNGIPWNCLNLMPSSYFWSWSFQLAVPHALLLIFSGSRYIQIYNRKKVLDEYEIKVTQQKLLVGDINNKSSVKQSKKSGRSNKIKPLFSALEEDATGEENTNLDTLFDVQEEVAEESSEELRSSKDRDSLKIYTRQEIEEQVQEVIHYSIVYSHFLTVTVASLLLEPFACTSVSENFQYLGSYPDFSCFSASHSMMKFLSYTLGFIWFILFPGLTLYILIQGWNFQNLGENRYLRQFGWLTSQYEMRYYWWESVHTVRKILVVVLAHIFKNNGYVQLMILMSFLCLNVFSSLYFRPYKTSRYNVLELVLLAHFLLCVAFSYIYLVGSDGMEIFTTVFGSSNEIQRKVIPQPQPGMSNIANKIVNTDALYQLSFHVTFLVSFVFAGFIFLHDLHEVKMQSPKWVLMFFNAITGLSFLKYEEYTSYFGLIWNSLLFRLRRQRRPPPTISELRWVERVISNAHVTPRLYYHDCKTFDEMLTNVHESYQEEDWAKDESTCLSYIHALDQYVFSYETLYSKSLELYALERERNKAKMYILSSINARLQALERNVNVTIGENEKKLNQIFDLERSRQNCVALQEGIRHRGQLTAEQSAEQKRRFVDVEEWKRMYDNERKKSEILRQKVEKARKELLLYHIEHSSSSDSEENDEYLRRQVEEYIESMTAQDFVEEGKIEPLPKFYE